jgi:hypothetical protein
MYTNHYTLHWTNLLNVLHYDDIHNPCNVCLSQFISIANVITEAE